MSNETAPSTARLRYIWDHVETDPGQLRRRKLIRIGVAVLAVVVIVLGVYFFAIRDNRPKPVITGTFGRHDKALITYMMAAPAGAEQLPDGTPLPESAIPAIAGTPHYEARHNFVRSDNRQWLREDGSLVSVELLKFPDEHDAAYYLRDILDYTKEDRKVEENKVAGVPGGRSLRLKNSNTIDGSTEYLTISAAPAGDLAVIAVVYAPAPEPDASTAESILTTAYSKL